MDEAQFDRWTCGLVTRLSRRGLTAVAGGALATIGLGTFTEAKRKKGKGKGKGKKKKQTQRCTSPSSRCQSASECCNAREDATRKEVCTEQDGFSEDAPVCCLPVATTSNDLTAANCCTGLAEDVPGGGQLDRCCIGTGKSDQGNPALCCGGGESVDGLCCLPSGAYCEYRTCCNGGSVIPCPWADHSYDRVCP